MREKGHNWHAIMVGIVIVLIFALVYAMNYYTPLFADDYSYMYSFSTGERIMRITEIWDSQKVHYHSLNGRSVTHTLAQLFLLVGDCAFNFWNSLAFVLLLLVICVHGTGNVRRLRADIVIAVAAMVFLATPAFGQSFLWITGAANYLYGVLIVMLVLLPYRLQAASEKIHAVLHAKEIVKALLMLIAGIIAGWTNENMSIAVIAMMVGFIVVLLVRKKPIYLWNITGVVGAIIGCLVMLLSPGTSNRLQNAGGSGGIVMWIRRAVFYTCDMVVNLQTVLILVVALLTVYIYRRLYGKLVKDMWKNIKNDMAIPAVYLLGFLASVYSMIVSPQFPKRAWSGPTILLVVVTLLLCEIVIISEKPLVAGKRTAWLLLVLLCIPTYIYAVLELKNIDAAYCERVSTIQIAVDAGEKSAEVSQICGWSGYSCYESGGDLNEDSTLWPNTVLAKYYGLEEIICDE